MSNRQRRLSRISIRSVAVPEAPAGRKSNTPWHPTSIEDFIERARPGDRLFVHLSGAYRVGKAAQDSGAVACTIEKGWVGELFFRDGSPSLNGTFVSERGNLIEVTTALKLGAGKLINLSRDVNIRLPDELTRDSATPPEMNQLEESIARIPRGGQMILGREHKSIRSSVVSRHHCTLGRLDSGAYMLVDGILSKNGVLVRPFGEDAFQRIYGWTRVEPGSTVAIVGLREIEIPNDSKMESPLSDIFGVDRAHSYTIQEALRLSGSQLLRPEIETDYLRVTIPQAMILAGYIEKGLALLREGSYAQAIAYFSNQSAHRVAEAGGYKVSSREMQDTLLDLAPASVQANLVRAAECTWFTSSLQANFCPGALPEHLDLQRGIWLGTDNARERNMTDDENRQAQFYIRNLALIVADKWIRAFQHALGRPVSFKAVLIEKACATSYDALLEVDSAQFLREHAVTLTHFYLSRSGRAAALEVLRGSQDAHEVKRVAGLLSSLPPGESRTIGSQAEISLRHPAGKKGASFSQVKPVHCRVTRIDEGTFAISDAHESYVRNKSGVWKKLAGEIRIPAGTRIRVSPHYEIMIGHPS